MIHYKAKDWIKYLSLKAHPEGGFYQETYRSEGQIQIAEQGLRAYSTAIYFLLQGDDFSAFHRIKSDELWHFYAGNTLEIMVLDEASGALERHLLGQDIEAGNHLQLVVPAGKWFASRLQKPQAEHFALVGCTVAPGFDFEDFEMAKAADLVSEFPQHQDHIRNLCRL